MLQGPAMRAIRTVAAVAFVSAFLASASVAAEKAREYAKELRQAQSQQQGKRYKECVRACDEMLAAYKEASQVKEVSWLKVESLVLDGQYEGALRTLERLAEAVPGDKELQAAVALRTGDVQRMLKKFDEALATYGKAAEGYAKELPDQAAEAQLRAGDLLCTDLKKPDQGIARYRQVETVFGAERPRLAAEAARRVAVTHETQNKDLPQAAAAYQLLAGKYSTVYDQQTLAGFWGKSVDCLVNARQSAEAAAAAGKAETVLEAVPQKAVFAVRHGDLLLEMKSIPEARAGYERVLYSYPREQNACQEAQSRIVETYRAEGNWTEALGAARILYDAAGSEEGIRRAAQTVAQAFLAVDGHLGRANEFLLYQRFGPDGPDGKPKTEDDLALNHLTQVKYPARSALANEHFQAAVDAQPRNYEGYRAKGLLYICWGKPKEGAAQFLLAFKAADLSQVPAAAQELVLIGMKACTASFKGLERIFEYLGYGPKGKSGKEDLPDPFVGLVGL